MSIATADRFKPAAAFLLSFFGVFALFCVATAILFWPLLPQLQVALIGPPGDNLQDFWNTWYVAVGQDSGNFFYTRLIRFPEGTPLNYHSFAYPEVFAIALVAKFVGAGLSNLIFLHNLSVLISFPLAGLGAFYLVQYFTKSTVGSLVGAFVFAFNPSHVAHAMQHAHVASIESIPFFVLCYLLAIEQKSIAWLASAIVFFALSALSSWYYLFYLAYFILFHAGYLVIRNRTLPRGWDLIAPIACLAGVVIALSPMLIPMVLQGLGNKSVYIGGSTKIFVADVAAYFAFPPLHLLGNLTQGIYAQLTGNDWESTVYLGLVNLVLLGWVCLFAKQRDRKLLAYVLLGMGVFCIFASGYYLHVLGKSIIPMPDAILDRLPFFRNVRTPSRAIVFVYLFLAIGIGHAIALLWDRRRQPAFKWSLLAVIALIVVDFFPANLKATPVSCSSPGLAFIRDDPEQGFGVLNLPGGYLEGNAYMTQQICHGRPIAQGETSRDLVVSLRDRLNMQDLVVQRQQLTEAKIKYIIIAHPAGELFRWDPKNGRLDAYFRAYRIIYDGTDLTVLQVY